MMNEQPIYGYAGKILRVNLDDSSFNDEALDEATLRKYIGGASLGIKLIYDEVPPEIDWTDPRNRLFIGTGPLGGTKIAGSGAVAVVTKGALTNGMASTQANGFFGTFLRLSGYDGLIMQGAAPDWAYLYIHDGKVEFRDAGHLVGKNTYEVDSAIKEELQKKDREISILSIGPAGENLVRFACIFVDLGHIAAHNGVGAVMGSKKLKAIVVQRGKTPVTMKDSQALSQSAKDILAVNMADPANSRVAKEGTIGGVVRTTKGGVIAVKNYTTSVHKIDPAKLEDYTAESIRTKFKAKPAPCWACPARHCHTMEITEGKYAGRIVEEPEYEDMAVFSALVGIDDVTTSVVLSSEVDRLGMDANETGWVIAWLMECYEKGIITKADTGGLEMTWGNGEAIMAMLNMIANRQGIGDMLAEGVMRAAAKVGGEAPKMAIHTAKGNTPRTHDHRVMWFELFDTCVSNTGTLESSSKAPNKLLGIDPDHDKFDPIAVSTVVAKIKGVMVFEDSVITCRYQTGGQVGMLCDAIKAATGWDMDAQEAIQVGKRAVNIARGFNLRCGIGAKLDAPSPRYGSMPHDGSAAGKDIMASWDEMLQNYYALMGWDANGIPLPQTLRELGLEDMIPQLRA